MVSKTGFRALRLILPAVTTGLLSLHSACTLSDAGRTVVEKPAVEPPIVEQPVSRPTVHDIESSVLDADFSPGEANTNTPAELDEIYAPHEGHLDFTRVARPLDYLVNPLDALDEATGLRLGVARYAYSNGTLTNVRNLAQAGLGFNGLLGRDDDLTGAALSVAFPRRDTSRNETVFETFHRFQMTKHSQLSVGVQVIFDPGNAPESKTIGILYARLRTSF